MFLTDSPGHSRLVGDAFDEDGDLEISGLYFPRAEVARLRDHLSRLLDDQPETGIVAGREYRLLPGSKFRSVGRAARSRLDVQGTTRVRVIDATPDADGDVRVCALNGTRIISNSPVDPAYLAPLDTPVKSDLGVIVETLYHEAAMYSDREESRIAAILSRIADGIVERQGQK